ncbi:MAG: hypothetical protein A2020_11745 [Lentisphaerae bacterium GWF2_45_14]|nr:MAG: hypothetical protein A2020_11745 [Lentisphaerae bacterium GWF2_45_14]
MSTEELYTRIFRIKPDESHNYYDILGVKLFEKDIELIHQAALLRFSDLNNLKSGNSGADNSIEGMYFDLSRAATTLEVPEKKAEYDIKLADKMGIKAARIEKASSVKSGAFPIMKLDKDAREKLENAGKLYQEQMISEEQTRLPVTPIPRPNITEKLPEPEIKRERPPAVPKKEINLRKCPACGARMSECSVLCIECGYDIVRKDFIITKKFSSAILPPSPSFRQVPASRRFLNESLREIKKRLLSFLSCIVLILLVSIFFVLLYRMSTWRSDFIVDSGNLIISGAWKDSFSGSAAWQKYFETMKKSGRKPPFVKAEVKIGHLLDQYGFRHKYYDYSIIELYSGRITGSGHLNVSGGENFNARIQMESAIIQEAVEKAIPVH